MIPNLNFIKTMLNGIRSWVEKRLATVEGKIHTPDYAADEGQDGYIKNRPFYTEQAYVLPETTVEFDPDSGEAYLTDPIELVEGNTYTVMWNGAEYSCVVKPYMEDGVQFGVAVGDLGIVETGEPITGEPFVAIVFGDVLADEFGASAVICSFDGSDSATLSIGGEVVHKLDEKYLPDAGAAILYVNSDGYVYKLPVFDDESNRATNEYVKSLFLGSQKVFLHGTGMYNNGNNNEQIPYTLYVNILIYQDFGEWGAVIPFGNSIEYHTAEYTG